MLTFPYGETVTIIRRTIQGRDGYGNDIYVETSTDYPNVPVWQTGSTENPQGGDVVTSDVTALLPVGAVVSEADKVRRSGLDYEVTGHPFAPTSPLTGTQPGVVVNLRRVTG